MKKKLWRRKGKKKEKELAEERGVWRVIFNDQRE
jgi:hypothetical protein